MADWYRKMAFYQIWIRSFADGNGDGIGDLYGVYEKLPYIKSLGVDGIWFSPIYPSPNADYGYDISDYKNIHPDYGDLDQFRKVLDRAHALHLKVLMDLVVNHTSDEHPWFLESRKGRDNPYSDYYIWRDKPNNWNSLFEGKAWAYDETRGQYYLHIFAKKQPDLNMDNPAVREEVKSIMRFWLDMGVDGFREDVINFISKKEGLPNGLPFLPAVNGMPYYKDGPHIHEYLREFREVCKAYDCIQIGEGPMTTVKSAMRYLSGKDQSLDMMISFDHMMADCVYTEYIHRPFSAKKLKKALSRWQYALQGKAWNVLYLENHDHPRIISRYGSERLHRESGTALATAYLFLQGTPFVYQGQEIGMLNIRLSSILQYKDVSTHNNYHSFHTKDPERKRLQRIHLSSRDSSRTPMQWSAKKNAGFTTGAPWFEVNPNYERINVAMQEQDPNSILWYYRRALKLRRESRTLLYGTFRAYLLSHPQVFVYTRTLDHTCYLIIVSLSRLPASFRLPKRFQGRTAELRLTNGTNARKRTGKVRLPKMMILSPYEAFVFRLRV